MAVAVPGHAVASRVDAPAWRIGTAGWVISRDTAERFPGEGRHLERYAQRLRCAEINSSFHRSHRPHVYERWAAQTPPGFAFSVKLPKTISHVARLRGARDALDRFLDESAALGERRAVILVQLPPSLAFEARTAGAFFTRLARRFDGDVVCEARHPSWADAAADRALAGLRVGRVAADPAPFPAASRPGGWLGPHGDGAGATVYHRWHGAPRMYWSRYDAGWLRARADELARWPAGTRVWCVFDNTASGAAIGNALELDALGTAHTPRHVPGGT